MNKAILFFFFFFSSSVLLAGGGHSHHVLVRPDGSMWAWGANDFGQLGTNSNLPVTAPVEIGSGNHWISVSRGQFHNIALDKFGQVWSWGLNKDGQLGVGHINQVDHPSKISGIPRMMKIAAGAYHSAAISNSGNIYAWGKNTFGQLGDNTIVQKNNPTVLNLGDADDVSCGTEHTLALIGGNAIYAWGSNGYGQLGHNLNINVQTPVFIASYPNIVSLKAGAFTSSLISGSNLLYGWGKNISGILGDGSVLNLLTPMLVNSNVKKNDFGSKHSLAIRDNNGIDGSGGNQFNQLGLGSKNTITTYSNIDSQMNWVDLDLGEYHNIIESGNGSLYSFGRNNVGQSGVGGIASSVGMNQIFGPMSRFENKYSLLFEGVSQYVSINDHDDLSFGNGSNDTPFSISAWINMREKSQFSIFNKHTQTGTSEYLFQVEESTGILQLHLWDGVSTNATTRIRSLSSDNLFSHMNQWIHVACSYDGSGNEMNIKLYLNGNELAATYQNGGSYVAMENTTVPARIGIQSGYGKFSNGLEDEVSLWNKELDSSEILELYNSGVPKNLSKHSASTNLLGWWRMGEKDIFPSLKDHSGSDHFASMVNMNKSDLIPTFPSFNEKLINFDGIDDTINLGQNYNYDLNDAFSISMWIQSSANGVLLSKLNPNNNYRGYEVVLTNTGTIKFSLVSVLNSNLLKTDTSNAYNDNKEHFISITYDGSNLTSGVNIYVDGVNEALNTISDNLSTTILDVGQELHIGSRNATNQDRYTGKIDELALWNKKLDSNEVLKVFSGNTHINLNSISISDNLTAWWRMGDNDSFPIVKDNSISLNDGTMVNMGNVSIESRGNNPTSTSFIYWVDKSNDGNSTDHLVKANLDGSGNTYILTSPGFAVQNFGAYLTTSDTHLYWVDKANDGSNEEHIVRSNFDGSGNTYIFSSPGFAVQNFGTYLNVTDTNIYWVDKSNDGNSTDFIKRANLDGSGNVTIFSSPGSTVQNFGSYLNVTDTHMYWVDKSNDGNSTDFIKRANLDGSGNVTIFSSPGSTVQNFGSYLTTTDNYIYWVDKSNDGNSTDFIKRANLDGSGNTTIFSSPGFTVQNFGSHLNITDTHMYWVQKSNDGNSTDQLVRANLDGSGNTVILSSPGFAVQNFGSYMKIKK
jgi:alpha-tubulin suppressor-like RCC1 family protein